MIARLWHGWTTRENADAYEALLRSEVLPGIHRIPGYHGAYLLRREAAPEVEFATLTLFDSWDAVRAFAGPDREVAVVPPGGPEAARPVRRSIGPLRDPATAGLSRAAPCASRPRRQL